VSAGLHVARSHVTPADANLSATSHRAPPALCAHPIPPSALGKHKSMPPTLLFHVFRCDDRLSSSTGGPDTILGASADLRAIHPRASTPQARLRAPSSPSRPRIPAAAPRIVIAAHAPLCAPTDILRGRTALARRIKGRGRRAASSCMLPPPEAASSRRQWTLRARCERCRARTSAHERRTLMRASGGGARPRSGVWRGSAASVA
jgi:hypothetical protein